MDNPSRNFADSALIRERNPIFRPQPDTIARSQMTAFMRYCERATSRSFTDYWSFQSFAAEDFRLFWRLFFAWSELVFEGQLDPVCLGDSSESASFFPNLRLNYAEVLLADRGGGDDRPALTACHVDGRTERLSRGELRERALSLARSLWRLGVRPGDRVVVVTRNSSGAIIGALATAALGAAFELLTGHGRIRDSNPVCAPRTGRPDGALRTQAVGSWHSGRGPLGGGGRRSADAESDCGARQRSCAERFGKAVL